jgi:hypothetical protein
MSDDIQTPEVSAEEPGLIAYLFTNHKEQAPIMQSLLDMIYRGVYANTIGIQSAFNAWTDKEEFLIVGVEHDGETTRTYPLFKVLDGAEAGKYLFPDGEGGWLNEAVDE